MNKNIYRDQTLCGTLMDMASSPAMDFQYMLALMGLLILSLLKCNGKHIHKNYAGIQEEFYGLEFQHPIRIQL